MILLNPAKHLESASRDISSQPAPISNTYIFHANMTRPRLTGGGHTGFNKVMCGAWD